MKTRRKGYAKWRAEFNKNLLDPNMPLLTPVPSGDTERLIEGWWRCDIKPWRAAELFNLRFLTALKAQEEAEGEQN